ncbi:hypothetical protein NEOLEDRAFT_1177007 [Neolentinus lepideus HHB14362 ss-1]|uniref:Uncharacterized protein n=1 Tax=Neolentinus lepideus HHB14362 ss-1 TaxID=1314782 RepID=A0A165TVF0_9AGAM|nr:hypothetical protein NEOLEDRAFT_1177007 [Neolentinus lepideus HHB14362 ss-1]
MLNMPKTCFQRLAALEAYHPPPYLNPDCPQSSSLLLHSSELAIALPPIHHTWAELVTTVDDVMAIPDHDATIFAISVDLIPVAISYLSTVTPSQQCAHLQLIHHLFELHLNSVLMAEAILNMPTLDPACSEVTEHPPPVTLSHSSASTTAAPKACPMLRPVAKATQSSGSTSDAVTACL